MNMESLPRIAYNGFRAVEEEDDGGPFYLTEDKWAEEDHAAWANAAAWTMHYGLGGATIEELIKWLTNHAEFLEDLEMRGVLATDLPIEGSLSRSYSEEVRKVIAKLSRGLTLSKEG